jgi:hypothetical protein
MNQEVLAGIGLCLMGLCLMFVPPYRIWQVTDKWKSVGGKRPSQSFVIITKVLGVLFAAAGGYILIFGL